MAHGYPAGSSRLLATFLVVSSLNAAAASAGIDSDCPGSRSADDANVLVVRTDEARGRIWILGTDALYLHEKGVSAEPRSFRLPGWMHVIRSQACPPDMAIDYSGAAIVSSNIVPRLWRIDPESLAVIELDVRLHGDEGKDIGFTSLELLHPGSVRASSSTGRSRWEIQLHDKTARKLGADLRADFGVKP